MPLPSPYATGVVPTGLSRLWIAAGDEYLNDAVQIDSPQEGSWVAIDGDITHNQDGSVKLDLWIIDVNEDAVLQKWSLIESYLFRIPKGNSPYRHDLPIVLIEQTRDASEWTYRDLKKGATILHKPTPQVSTGRAILRASLNLPCEMLARSTPIITPYGNTLTNGSSIHIMGTPGTAEGLCEFRIRDVGGGIAKIIIGQRSKRFLDPALSPTHIPVTGSLTTTKAWQRLVTTSFGAQGLYEVLAAVNDSGEVMNSPRITSAIMTPNIAYLPPGATFQYVVTPYDSSRNYGTPSRVATLSTPITPIGQSDLNYFQWDDFGSGAIVNLFPGPVGQDIQVTPAAAYFAGGYGVRVGPTAKLVEAPPDWPTDTKSFSLQARLRYYQSAQFALGASYYYSPPNAAVTTSSTSTSDSTSDSSSSSASMDMSQSQSNSTSTSHSVSTSASNSTSTSMSSSTSNSTSQSMSDSTSMSMSMSMSMDTSQSTSMSNSISTSISDSTSTSNSQSQSTSTSNSTSQSRSNSTSHSTSMSTSNSISDSDSTSTSNSMSNSMSSDMSTSTSNSSSTSNDNSNSTSNSTSTSMSNSTSMSMSMSMSMDTSQSTSMSNSMSTSISDSTSESHSGTASDVGTSVTDSKGSDSSISSSTSNSFSGSSSMSSSTSNSMSNSQSLSSSTSTSMSGSTSTSMSMSTSNSMSTSTSMSNSTSQSSSQSTSHSNSNSNSNSTSDSTSNSNSDSTSESQSNSSSNSQSQSESSSVSNSTSNSTSFSNSMSQSTSNSTSTSTSHSTSDSTSSSQSNSTSNSISTSDSSSASDSDSFSTSSSMSTSQSQSNSTSTSISSSVSNSSSVSISKTIFFETFGLVFASQNTCYVGVQEDSGSFTQIGPTIPYDGTQFHLCELTTRKTQNGASFRMAMDNQIIGGWDQYDVHLTEFNQSGVDVGQVTLASNYLGGGLIAGGAQDDIDWDPSRNAAGYVVSWQWGDSPFMSKDVGNVTFFSHQIPQPVGTFIDVNTPPQLPPVSDFVQVRPSIGGGSAPIRMFQTPIMRGQVAGGQQELMKLGLLPFPPGASEELNLTNDPCISTLALDVRTGAIKNGTFNITDLYFFPIDQEDSWQQITATAQGLGGQGVEWRIGTNRWGRSYARLYDFSGNFLGNADIDGAIGAGPGETIFSLCCLREGSQNSFIPDSMLEFQAEIMRIPRWTFLAVPGGGY